jgi:hypothetical protein
MTHDRVLSVDLARSLSARPPLSLRFGSRAACPAGASTTTHAPFSIIPTQYPSPPRAEDISTHKRVRGLEYVASAFGLRMAVSVRPVCAHRRRIYGRARRAHQPSCPMCDAERRPAWTVSRRRAHAHARLLFAEGARRRAGAPRRAAKARPALLVFRRLHPPCYRLSFEPAQDQPWRTHATMHGFLAVASTVRRGPRRSPARPSSASWLSSTYIGPFYTTPRRTRSARPVRAWRLLLRPMDLRPYIGVIVPGRDEKAAGRDGGVERSLALDREHGRPIVGWRDAAAMRTIVRAVYLLLPSHVDASKFQYLFTPSYPPGHRSAQSFSSHPSVSARVRHKPSCEVPPRARLEHTHGAYIDDTAADEDA